MYTILIDESIARISSRELLRELHARRIQTRPLWQPIHRSPAHRDAQARSCPVADKLHTQALSLPCSVGLNPAAQASVVDAIKGILAKQNQPVAAR
jgi:perosamine synthetase